MEVIIDELGYVDTGAEIGGLFFPRSMLKFIDEELFTHRFYGIDGEYKEFDCIKCKATIANIEFETTVVLTDDTEIPVIGRGILDKFIAEFNGPKQKLSLKV